VDVQISLRTLDPEMARAWREAFQQAPQVDIALGNILDFTADAIMSPANSFGFMDGGIDLAYRGFFGPKIEDRLQQHLKTHHHGELPVGQAAVLETRHAGIPYFVSAPTMRVPASIDEAVNVYLAFRAALLAVMAHNRSASRPIRSVLSPAFGTGIGGMDFRRAARQMHAAYRAAALNERPWLKDARSVLQHHHELLR
jgi:O-acetyl-ADP-ribose deacetylase (regulator of RNase III)